MVSSPLYVKEGLLEGLFKQGHIIFDTGNSIIANIDWNRIETTELSIIASAGGASFIVAALVNLSIRGEDIQHIEIRTNYHLISLKEGRILVAAEETATNKGMETYKNREDFSFEMGLTIASHLNQEFKE